MACSLEGGSFNIEDSASLFPSTERLCVAGASFGREEKGAFLRFAPFQEHITPCYEDRALDTRTSKVGPATQEEIIQFC